MSYGSGIIALERGWTMVISGSAMAAGGCLLVGIATAAGRLGGIWTELRAIHNHLEAVEAARPVPQQAEATIAPPADPLPERTRPVMPAHPPSDDIVVPPAESPGPAPAHSAPPWSAVPTMSPPLPPFSVVEPPRTQPVTEPAADLDAASVPSQAVAVVEDSFDPLHQPPSPLIEDDDQLPEPTASFPEAEAIGLEEQPSANPEHDDPASPPDGEATDDTAHSPAKDALAPGEPLRTIVGSYSSGDNSYVMYSDGSIHAHTPTGQYQFDSLDELKRFADGVVPPQV